MFDPLDELARGADKGEALAARAQALAEQRARLDAEEAGLLIEVEQWRMSGLSIFRNTEAFLRTATGVSGWTSRTRAQVARQLLVLPLLRDALGEARVTFDHARVLAEHADSPNRDTVLDQEAELVAWACELSADDFRSRLDTWARDLDEIREADVPAATRRWQRRRVRRCAGPDGLRRTILDLDEETDAVVHNAVRDVVAEMNRADQNAKIPLDQRRSSAQKWADAFAEIARRSRAADLTTRHKARPTILAICDMSVLWDQLRINGVCELDDGTQLTARQLRRLACEADIIPMVLDTNGVPLDMGRAARLATPKQRLALRALHATCAVEGCNVDFDWCEIHHLKPWERKGLTNLDNLIPLCEYHHHLVHDTDGEVRSYQLLPDRTLRLRGLPLPVAPRRRTPLIDRLKRPPDLAPARR